MKNSIKKFIILFFLMAAPVVMSNVIADNPQSPGGNPSGGVPIDGGASIVIAASAIYGARKARKAMKIKKDEIN